MGIGEPSLSSSQPFSISSFGWLRVEVSNLLCFYAFSALLLLAFWFSLVKAPLAFVFYILWILGLILHKQTLLKNPRGDLSRFCIFGPCRKTSPTFWRLRWGVKLLTQEKWCLQRGGTSKEMVFLTPTCHSKGNCMMFYRARRALWSWAWKSSILSSLRYWRWSDSCNKIASTSGNHPRSEGWRDYQLSYSRKKNFFHSSILLLLLLLFLAIILMDESSYISCFTWYLWKFLLQHENAKMASHKSNREGNDGSNK